MIRRSRALLFGTLASWIVAVAAFAGGWYAARTFGDRMDLGTFVASMLPNRQGELATPRALRDDFAVFWDVWNLVDREFYTATPLDQKKMVYGAIKGMLGSLGDDYTVFQEPDAAAQTRESMQGSLEGIGAYIRVKDGQVQIDRPIKNSPASRAGLLPGDVLVEVDGTVMADLIKGLPEGDAAAKAAATIRGQKGTKARLVVRRPPATDTFTLEVVREAVPLVSVNGQMLPGNIAYIQITDFKANTSEELDKIVRELLSHKPSGIILDLRNNPGGFLNTAQQVLGHFYDGVALYEDKHGSQLEELKTIVAADDVKMFDQPLIVLVNGGSASAAEIVAGALRDQRPNTRLVGEKSFGKGSVQNIHTLSDGSSARITIAHWLTPNKSEIHKIGITPQYVVPFSADATYGVPCLGEQQPIPGQQGCADAQFFWGLRMLSSSDVPPQPVPTPTPKPAG